MTTWSVEARWNSSVGGTQECGSEVQSCKEIFTWVHE